MRPTLRAAALLVLIAACFGCAKADRPISLQEFNSFCWPAQIEYNCPDDNLCQDFTDYLAQEHQGKDDCVAGCLAMGQAKNRAYPLTCSYPIINATDWCESYCRRYYDNQDAVPARPGEVTVPATVSLN